MQIRSRAAAFESLESRRLLSGTALDESFGTEGVAVHRDFGFVGNVAVQGRRRVIVSSGGELVRFKANGAIDRHFGSKGRIPKGEDWLLRDDGRILTAELENATGEIVVRRYSADGALEAEQSRFTPQPSVQSDPRVKVLETGGVVVGTLTVLEGAPWDVWDRWWALSVTRYKTDGSIDETFGEGGSANGPRVHNYNLGREDLGGMWVGEGGEILIAGHGIQHGTSEAWRYAIFNARGELVADQRTDFFMPQDAAFARGGELALLNTEGTQAAGESGHPEYHYMAERGEPLESLLIDGAAVAVDFKKGNARAGSPLAVRALAGGGWVVAGTEGRRGRVGVRWLEQDGRPDARFGSRGAGYLRLGGGVVESVRLAQAPDGDVIVAAVTRRGDRYDLRLARVEGSATR